MTTRRTVVFVTLVGTLHFMVGVRAGQQLSAPTAVSVEQEPRHRPVFENAFARVLDVRVPAGDTTLYHTHSHRSAGVVLESATTWVQVMGAERAASSAGDPVGTVLDNWSQQLPYTHRVGNADTTAFHYLIGEWLASSGADAPKLSDTTLMKMEKESPLLRVYRITLPPGASAARHQHGSAGFTVHVQDGRVTEEGSTPTATGGGSGSGAWRWRAAGYSHTLRNPGSAPLDIIEVDWLTGNQAPR